MVAQQGVPDLLGVGAARRAQQTVDAGADVLEGLFGARAGQAPARVLFGVVDDHDVDVVDGLELGAAAEGSGTEGLRDVGLAQQGGLEQVPALAGQLGLVDILVDGPLVRVECVVDAHFGVPPGARCSAPWCTLCRWLPRWVRPLVFLGCLLSTVGRTTDNPPLSADK